jgi:hypothetical protein
VRPKEAAMASFEDYLSRHWSWSRQAFGDGRQTNGILEHIGKELAEIRAKPDDLVEWVDVMILAFDGYLRHGGSVDSLMRDLEAKQAENLVRRWPLPGDGQHAVEHLRDSEED